MAHSTLVLIRTMVIYNLYVVSYNQLSPSCKNAEWRNDTYFCLTAQEKPRETTLLNNTNAWMQMFSNAPLKLFLIYQTTRIVWASVRKLVLHPQQSQVSSFMWLAIFHSLNKTAKRNHWLRKWSAHSRRECGRGSLMGCSSAGRCWECFFLQSLSIYYLSVFLSNV